MKAAMMLPSRVPLGREEPHQSLKRLKLFVHRCRPRRSSHSASICGLGGPRVGRPSADRVGRGDLRSIAVLWREFQQPTVNRLHCWTRLKRIAQLFGRGTLLRIGLDKNRSRSAASASRWRRIRPGSNCAVPTKNSIRAWIDLMTVGNGRCGRLPESSEPPFRLALIVATLTAVLSGV